MTKRKTNKRNRIPLFSLKAGRDADYSQLAKLPDVRKVVMEETFNAIKDGISKRKKSTSIFEVAYSDYYIDLEKDKWKPALENVMKYYIETEEYDLCAECRDLINKL